MNRRSLFASIGGFVAVGPAALGNPEDAANASGRPALAIEPEGPWRWRVRSWEWRNSAWRPAIGHAMVTSSGIELRGRIAVADRAEVRAQLSRGIVL